MMSPVIYVDVKLRSFAIYIESKTTNEGNVGVAGNFVDQATSIK